jgi:hypothetical protein
MAGMVSTGGIFVPTIEESQALLNEMTTWIKQLKALNVSADIAAFVARDCLSPMRIPEVPADDTKEERSQVGKEQTICEAPVLYIPDEDE